MTLDARRLRDGRPRPGSRRARGWAAALAVGCAAGALAAAHPPAAKPSLAEIVAKNVAARGGIDAWRQVHGMTWVGHIESARTPLSSRRFVLEQERPDKTHFETTATGERTLRIYDGTRGWTLRTARDGRPQVRPFTVEELVYAQGAPGIDGPLIDAAAKRIGVTLGGLDAIDGRKAYRLVLTLPSGESDRLWIDATTFLELRYDRTLAGEVGGASRVISTRYRDYRAFDGLQIPGVIETGASAVAGATPDRMVVEEVRVNPSLDSRAFADPAAPRTRSAVLYTPRPRSTPGAAVAPVEAASPVAVDPGSAPR